MTAQRNHYEVLGVSPTANTDQIKTKYRELARKFHPDVVKDKALGQKVFTQINQAYRVLADPEKRAEYDAGLRAGVASATSAVLSSRPPSTASPLHRTSPSVNATNGTRPGSSAASAAEGLSAQQTTAARLINDADLALLNGDFAIALNHCENALRLDPENAKALGLLGDALAGLGRRSEAIDAYTQSLQSVASPMVQAKLSRLTSGGAAPSMPYGTPPRTERTLTSGSHAGQPPSSNSGSGNGLFGKLLGRKK